MLKSPETHGAKKFANLLIVLGLGAASLGIASCGNHEVPAKNSKKATPANPSPSENMVLITRQDCLEEYGNPYPFIGDVIIADPKTGTFRHLEGEREIDRGVAPPASFEDDALDLYDRFCGTPFTRTADDQSTDLSPNRSNL